MNRENNKQVWSADMGDGTFQNPILYADYSDPDVIRVGDDFYMTASSFCHVPGLPILHSKDLVNWTLINYAIPEAIDLPGYELPRHGDGVWAPSIRYHDNKFWIFFGAPDEGLFMTTAEDPRGSWSPLHLIKEVKGWIDCCPFWDEDGNAYLVHAFARSRCGIKHLLSIHRMSPDGKELLDEGKIIFDGTENHPTMEGPKMYKRNGYYYIFAPAGGVQTGWQTILRSTSPFGPYEDKIVLHQGDSSVNGPHQGGYVELDSGESWFLHFQDRRAYGRIVHMQPMSWENDWPVMGVDTNGDGIGEPVLRFKKPNVGGTNPIEVPATSDDFDSTALGLQWQWQANIQQNWYSLADNPGHIRLFAAAQPASTESLYGVPQLLMQKLPAPELTATAKLSFHPAAKGDRAGLVVFGLEFASLSLKSKEDEGYRLSLSLGDKEGKKETETAAVDVAEGDLYLRASIVREAVCTFSYSTDGVNFEKLGEPFTATVGQWVGSKMGIFAVNEEGISSTGYADCDWFTVE